MRILSTKLYNYNNKQNVYNTSFCSTSRTVNNSIYQTTKMLRGDLPWDMIPEFFEKLGQKFKEVNIYDFACSDGSEAWSLRFCLWDKLGEKANKFKIKASDIDPVIVCRALSGKCDVSLNDIYDMNELLKDGYLKYAYRDYPINRNYPSSIVPKDFIKENVTFETADMVKKIDELEGENNIVFSRNCLVYLSSKDREAYIKKLGEYKDKILAVAIGNYDVYYGFDTALKEQGYKESGLLNIYVKA